jgi:hypothetical protein
MIYQILGFVILPALIAAFFASVIPRKHKEKERFNKAADTYSSKVHTALVGIYPVNHSWDSSHYPKFQQSVLDIEIAAAEFMPVIKRKSEPSARELNAAVKNYHDYCQQKKYERAVTRSWFPNSPRPRKESGNDPVEEFKNIVEHLLSFANEK